ncbi:MAG: C2H2-type zinc finger protein [Candidatus Nanohaloarchaea archaeon]|nr:C2H2-type zinc finger protein [Candidatus Nanohaloarchaea archaeon]
MGPRGKMIVGAVLALGGVWWYVPGGPFNSALLPFSALTNLQSLAVAVQGSLGLVALLIGLFVVWIERDELRIRREMESREFGEQVQESVQAVAQGGERDEETGEHTCEECGESFDSERGLNIHKGQKH